MIITEFSKSTASTSIGLSDEIKKLAKDIAELTDQNAHTDAVLALAEFVNAKEFASTLNWLRTISKSLANRSIRPTERIERDIARGKLLEKVKKQYGVEAFKLLSSSF